MIYMWIKVIHTWIILIHTWIKVIHMWIIAIHTWIKVIHTWIIYKFLEIMLLEKRNNYILTKLTFLFFH